MWTNASVTITHRDEEIDNTTGNLAVADEVLILENARCVFSQARGKSREVYKEGFREFSKLYPALLIPGYESIQIPTGSQLRVVPDKGQAKDFTVVSALYTGGIREAHWEVELEQIA
ncbi:hypothetical protein [Blastopirellula marina]|nr:hypothetical protein [Blastopirellula marina]